MAYTNVKIFSKFFGSYNWNYRCDSKGRYRFSLIYTTNSLIKKKIEIIFIMSKALFEVALSKQNEKYYYYYQPLVYILQDSYIDYTWGVEHASHFK